ncbi:MAG TPA: AAA family ATPase [Candidatus Acidoferrum sp.]
MLIIFGGLPGVGKTTVARELARRIGAVFVRIDSIEQAIRDGSGDGEWVGEAGYLVGYAVAGDNLRLGRTVVADSVNPLAITRDAWVAVAERAGVRAMEVGVICSDAAEHRRRVEGRVADISGAPLPTWNEVMAREDDAWERERVVIDTAKCSVEEAVERIVSLV